MAVITLRDIVDEVQLINPQLGSERFYVIAQCLIEIKEALDRLTQATIDNGFPPTT